MLRQTPGPGLINLAAVARKILDSDFAPHLLKQSKWDFACELAMRHFTVLHPAAPGQALPWRFWLDLRGLSAAECLRAGGDIAQLMHSMENEWSYTQLPKFLRVLGDWDQAPVQGHKIWR